MVTVFRLIVVLSIAIGLSSAHLAAMELKTTVFQKGQLIPNKYTCQGEDVSPEVSFSGAPQGTVTFAFIVEDPDAPGGAFAHWAVWNIPGNAQGLAEGYKDAVQGANSFGGQGYQGPCPPAGKQHRYYFRAYALDTRLSIPEGSTAKQLQKAMEGHILDHAEIMGIFHR